MLNSTVILVRLAIYGAELGFLLLINATEN
jgi:hypothetical protein